MRVLYLINFAGKAGTEKYVAALVAAFNNKEVNGVRCECFFAYNVDGPLVSVMDEAGVPTFRVNMRHPFDLKAARTLAKLCDDNGIDVIHAQYPRENYIAVLARLLSRRKKQLRVVYTYHLVEEIPFAWRLMNRVMTRGDGGVIAVCSESARRLTEGGVDRRRITVIPNGVSVPERISAASEPSVREEYRRRLGIGGGTAVFTIMSRYSPEKGLNFLVDGALCLRDKCFGDKELSKRTDKPFVVLILGDGDGYDELAGRIGHFELRDVVKQLGYREDTAQLLSASDVYLNTSDYEAVSFAILEAMAAGLPLILTDVGGNPDLCGAGDEACGLLVRRGDPEALADAMLTLLRDESGRAELGERAYRRAAQKFSLENTLKSTLGVYLGQTPDSD